MVERIKGALFIDVLRISANQWASATKKLSEARRPDGFPFVDFTKLTKITVTWRWQEDTDVSRTIFTQAEQLSEISLKVSIPSTYAGLAEMVIPSIRTLKFLKLTAEIDESSDDPLSGFCHELEKISAPGCSIMEYISIGILVQADAGCKRGDEWGLLEKILTKTAAWLGLKDVSLKIQVGNYARDEEDELVEVLTKLPDSTQFKKLSTSETINFIFEVTEICV